MINSTVETQQFVIGGGNNTFVDKQNMLFQQLNDAERSMKRDRVLTQIEQICDDPEDCGIEKSPAMKKFRGKESIFKRPEAPLAQCLLSRKQPDFKRNPHKWTKYTLEDVSQQDMSERSNTAAALTFLREMEDRRDCIDNNMEVHSVSNRILFQSSKKHPKYNTSVKVQMADPSSSEPETSTFKSTKVIMPEYVVGQAVKKIRKVKKQTTNSKTKELKLTHLTEIDDDFD